MHPAVLLLRFGSTAHHDQAAVMKHGTDWGLKVQFFGKTEQSTEGRPLFTGHGSRCIFRLIRLWLPAIVWMACAAAAAWGQAYDVALQVRLEPQNHRLSGSATIAWPSGPAPLLALAAHAAVQAVTINDQPVAFDFSGGRLRTATSGVNPPLRLQVHYSAVFNDPVPERPLNTDNPGFGVEGAILPEGVFLLAGSGWYPRFPADTVNYTIEVAAPQGMLAVTAGRCMGHETRSGETISIWRIDFPVRGISLSAARYEVRRRQAGAVTIATYFRSPNADLAPAYLSATAGYLQLYSELFGPYPFGQFSVVENFFPTGYGFASYTLLGSSVLRLPFILDTSLGHEVAHCWWGNGVWVDPGQGNWSEGLTTYVADYLYKEGSGAQQAREYRLEWLRNMAALVDATSDFPLNAFVGRTDPVTKAVGYDKAAMVFHMLRRQVGEKTFWQALQTLYASRLFQPTRWTDIQAIFENQAGLSLEWFFDQWVRQKGAPALFLTDVQATAAGSRWMVTGTLAQHFPYYRCQVELEAVGAGQTRRQTVLLTTAQTRFAIRLDTVAQSLRVDPDVHLLRQLSVEEIPPTINALKSSRRLTVTAAPGMEKPARDVVQALGIAPAAVAFCGGNGQKPRGMGDLLIVGPCPLPAGTLADGVSLSSNAFRINGREYGRADQAFFAVFNHPQDRGRVVGLLHGLSTESAAALARKTTHYGKFSFLTLSEGAVQDKGNWPVAGLGVDFASR
jgi:hypothetical protein